MNKSMSFKKMQSGFTLVEIAIVLVIIGLLLGGVLKGTELIESAKVKRAVNEVNGVSTAFYAYQDRYQRLPGDDGPIGNLNARGGAWAAPFAGAGNNDGTILVTLAQTFNGGGESAALWRQLQAAGFLTGNPNVALATDTVPRNAFGGLIGFTNAAVGAPATNRISGRVVCLGSVPGKSAAAIDNQIDDGNGNTGRMRGIQGAANTIPSTAAGPAVYSEAQTYTVCMQI
jgi:prepilin-type N-terminal cleavage/methylation domain-containing protein